MSAKNKTAAAPAPAQDAAPAPAPVISTVEGSTVKLAIWSVVYPTLALATVEAAGLLQQLWAFAIGKLLAHRANPLAWEAFAKASGIAKATGASVRKVIVALKPEAGTEAITEAQVCAALEISEGKLADCVAAMRAYATGCDLLALIRAERSSTSKVDPMAANAQAIVASTPRFEALKAHLAALGSNAVIQATPRSVHGALFSASELYNSPFMG